MSGFDFQVCEAASKLLATDTVMVDHGLCRSVVMFSPIFWLASLAVTSGMMLVSVLQASVMGPAV
ncbi:MAG: hypothetical protein VR73_08725 [Gammaproteobacteria bacterium BRH_c0]|nr:MAG: hypothetical protein VR73_08725 [Gammaproteobacteria bacterium BRH_c0]